MSSLRQPEPLDPNVSNLAEEWSIWKDSFLAYKEASGYDELDEKKQCALLRHCIGPAGRKLAKTFVFTDEQRDKLDSYLAKFEVHCLPKRNITLERHKFNTTVQGTRTFEVFLADLRDKEQSCGYGEIANDLIKDRIVVGIASESTRQKLLQVRDLSLELAIDICRADERAKAQSRELATEMHVEAVRTPRIMPHDIIRNCSNCAGTHPRKGCKAFGKTCSFCGGKNHFWSVCRKRVRQDQAGTPAAAAAGHSTPTHTSSRQKGTRRYQPPHSRKAMAIRRAALHISSVAMLIRRAALHISSVAMLIRRAALHTSSVAMLIRRAALHISSVKMAYLQSIRRTSTCSKSNISQRRRNR